MVMIALRSEWGEALIDPADVETYEDAGPGEQGQPLTTIGLRSSRMVMVIGSAREVAGAVARAMAQHTAPPATPTPPKAEAIAFEPLEPAPPSSPSASAKASPPLSGPTAPPAKAAEDERAAREMEAITNGANGAKGTT